MFDLRDYRLSTAFLYCLFLGNLMGCTGQLKSSDYEANLPAIENDDSDNVEKDPEIEKIEKIPTENCSLGGDTYHCVTISYGDHQLQDYELWLPANTAQNNDRPLVIYIHGGGYFSGDKQQAYFGQSGMKEFLANGYAFATINYRLSGEFPFEKGVTGEFPVAMIDGATSVQDLKMRASHYGYNPDKIVLTGASAGGGISLWIAFHDDLIKPNSEKLRDRFSTKVSCVALSETQTTLNIPEVAILLGQSDFVADEGITGLYGLTPDSYYADEAANNLRFFESMEEASAISHLSADDNVKVMLTYSRDYGEVDIHSPEFGDYLAQGTPNSLALDYKRNSLTDFGISHSIKVNQENNKANVLDFVINSCF